MATTVFWIALAGAVYVYIGYPLVLMAWHRFARRAIQKRYQEPAVSLIIAMHDEINNVRSKMKNCLELDYPRNKLQVIVSLDAPTDGTDILLRNYADQRVQVVYSSIRRGKAATLNSGVAVATGEILIFTDARQRFETQAIRELVANFADE